LSKTKQVVNCANPSIRPASFAGQFYPADANQLSLQIKHFLSKPATISTTPQLILVPHAGIDYCGQTAAYAYKALINSHIKNVILIGPSHHALFSGIAIDDSDFWQTPLGQVAANHSFARQLISPHQISFNSALHRSEHSLEVQLPFLQTVLKNFTIIPILIGQTDQDSLKLLATNISPLLNDSNLIIISSDLSHYPDQTTANTVDHRTIDSILTIDPSLFNQSQNSLHHTFPAIDTFACGRQPIQVGLLVAQQLNLSGQLLNYTNSAQTGGDSNRVVGYAAIVFHHILPKTSQDSSTQIKISHQKILLNWSQQVLINFVNHQKVCQDKSPSTVFNQKRGVFVTLYKQSQLRGCIGNFNANQSIWKQVTDMTISAASQDSRFSPVCPSELDQLTIEISILSPLKQVSSWQDIDLSRHGVYLDFHGHTGTFLPQVAQQTNWSKQEFLSQLCSQKMNLPSDCYLDPDTKIFTYTAQILADKS